jgi:ATP-dependent DNA helicase DinG
MAEAVQRALEEQNHVIIEAGTGTGKTLAYLLPALIHGRRIIVSTGTKTLQDQIFYKDVPSLGRALGMEIRAAYMKGRNNYLCLNRLARAQSAPVLEGLDEVDYFEEVSQWSRETEIGDRAELSNLPESLSFWRHIDARSESCLGQKCPDYDACFSTRMRNRAQEADIVVVNHHLFFADLSLRNGNYGSVLPDYTAVILDEAHLVEEVASEYFGAQVSNYQIDDLVRDLGMLTIEEAEVDQELTHSVARMSRFADNFFMGFRDGRGEDGRYPIIPGTFARRKSSGEMEATPLGELYMALEGAIARTETTLDALKEKTPDVENLIRRLREIRFELEFIVTGTDKKFVYWLERRNRGVFLRASPIDVAGLLQDKLFEEVPAATFHSFAIDLASTLPTI